MKTNRKNKKVNGQLLFFHGAGLGLLGFATAVVCYAMDAQCSMYGNKMKTAEAEQAQHQRDLQHEIGKLARLRTPEELRKLMVKHGLERYRPLPQQIVNVDKTAIGGSGGWNIRFHPETWEAIKKGADAFDFVRSIRNKGKK